MKNLDAVDLLNENFNPTVAFSCIKTVSLY